ncbi:ABC transporter permease [Occultella kanbiaonis]|uniref:ABC transporter permease n=1 Tax=Occultella kanbiaonis TaxID=2675754 RepID=UPI001F2C3836|nr:ABC transporter permease [Occultella kanbiaonis]
MANTPLTGPAPDSRTQPHHPAPTEMESAELDTIRRSSRERTVRNLLYLGKRLLTYVFIAFVSIVLNFIFPRMMPNDPAESMIRDIFEKTGQRPSQFQIDRIHMMYGDPDTPILEQFWNYLVQLAHLDLGKSIMYYPMEVKDLIGDALGWTLWLALVSTLAGWLIGTYLGSRLGWRPGGRLDSFLTPLTMFFASIPAFWLGLIAVWQLSYIKGWFPAQGAVDQRIQPASLSNPDFLVSILVHSVLPMGVLIIVGFTGWLFTMRNMMITTVNEDYVHLARAKGLKPAAVRGRYAMRNAMLPNVTGLAQSIGASLTAVVLAETVFIYPGVGGLVGASTGTRDYPLLQALMLIIIFLGLIFNFIADSVYVLLDPRTREED